MSGRRECVTGSRKKKAVCGFGGGIRGSEWRRDRRGRIQRRTR
jgi:hypothetical protein